MNKDNRVTVNVIDQIAHVSLARPEKHNAIDMAMFQGIVATIAKLKKDTSIRAIILTGQGEDFCSGLDVKSVMKSKSSPIKLLFKWHPFKANLAQRVSTDWQDLDVPVIAAIHGRCWGGGLQIALGADIRISTPDASISILEGRWGLIPDMGGTIALRELCKMDKVKELAMTARFIDGNEALAIGMVTYVSDNPKELALSIAEEIKTQSPDSVAAVKKLYNRSWFGSKGSALMRESWYQIKILMGKNNRIKAYNQTHDNDKHKAFLPRKHW